MAPGESLDSSVFPRRKMSQAEKQRGWVKMKQSAVSAVKISIQGPAGLDKVYLSSLPFSPNSYKPILRIRAVFVRFHQADDVAIFSFCSIIYDPTRKVRPRMTPLGANTPFFIFSNKITILWCHFGLIEVDQRWEQIDPAWCYFRLFYLYISVV